MLGCRNPYQHTLNIQGICSGSVVGEPIYRLKLYSDIRGYTRFISTRFSAVALESISARRRVNSQDKSAYLKKYFSFFSTKTYVVGTQKNRLICLN